MDDQNFQEKMLTIDAELAGKKVPVHERAFQAFSIAAPDYKGPLMSYELDRSTFGEYEGPNLLEKINNWYKRTYGKRAYVARDLGKIPIIVKEEIYLLRIPLVSEPSEVNVLPLISGLTPTMAYRLTPAELNDIQNYFIEGYSLLQKFEDLFSFPEADCSKKKDNPFLDLAIEDKDEVVDCLEGPFDTNGAVFHSRQFAEKMLKTVLFHAAGLSEDEIIKYKHRIIDIYEEVSQYAKFPAEIVSEINYISQFNIDIRDSDDFVPNSDAVRAFWAGLRIGAFCAALLLPTS
ncbi:MAG: HEPN domain-containing protein [Smithella sp.]